MPATAFPEPVLASQATFRAVMDAIARPGAIKALPAAVGAPHPLSGTAAAVALALLDYETPVWLDDALSNAPEVADWIRMATGARVTTDPGEAAFALITNPALLPAFDVFSQGTAEYPDRSTTLVLQVERFGTGECLALTGPGIKHAQSFASEPLPRDFPARLRANRALFPRGVDLILVSPTSVAALPRSVSAAPEAA
jgi:alpha-D-ribose 1-methylphosphonate 5-triphosphate synthase subunit PhnH